MLRGYLLVLNNSYTFFGATVYVGVLWALHFFWFPTWRTLTVANYYGQFVPQTTAATNFFWYVVPVMFVTLIIMIVTEWRTPFRWVSVLAFLWLSVASYVGQGLIIPINKILDTGITDGVQLSTLMSRWIFYNDIRWVLLTGMWLTMLYYFIAKPNLVGALSSPATGPSDVPVA